MNKIKILIAMPIYEREQAVLNSICSLIDQTELIPRFEITLALGINKMNSQLEEFLTNYKNSKGIKIDIHNFGENLGKGVAINKLASLYIYDYIISMDSDMICVDKKWLIKMIYVFTEYNKHPARNMSNKKSRMMGSLCSNQIGATCHAINEHDPKRIELTVGDFTIVSHTGGSGIAGGVLMSNYETWNLVKGYPGKKLYASDDGDFNFECHKNNKLVGYVKEIVFYHPYEFNDKYREWKNTIIHSPNQFKSHQTELIPIANIVDREKEQNTTYN